MVGDSGPRYWVIAPYHADRPELWERVWQFDLDHGLISIGWSRLGDVSQLSYDELKEAVERSYPAAPLPARRMYARMLWDFYHEIKPGDVVIARRGTKRLAAVGTVVRSAYYEHAKNAPAVGAENAYSNHLGVRWADAPRDRAYDTAVFGMQTLYEINEEKYRLLVGNDGGNGPPLPQVEFVLEKYLEDFLVTNFDRVFGGRLAVLADPEQGLIGQQFKTDVGTIDILAREESTSSFVVIELKKGRESDQVVGQVLRYMGWVRDNLCQEGQQVKGMIICREVDLRLTYALKMTQGIALKVYRVDFKLLDAPGGASERVREFL